MTYTRIGECIVAIQQISNFLVHSAIFRQFLKIGYGDFGNTLQSKDKKKNKRTGTYVQHKRQKKWAIWPFPVFKLYLTSRGKVKNIDFQPTGGKRSSYTCTSGSTKILPYLDESGVYGDVRMPNWPHRHRIPCPGITLLGLRQDTVAKTENWNAFPKRVHSDEKFFEALYCSSYTSPFRTNRFFVFWFFVCTGNLQQE